MEERESLFASIMISINCCVAGSIFGVPWGFVQAGWVFSIFLSVLGLICMISLGFIVIQVLSRMSHINKLSKSGFDITHVPITHFFNPYPPSYYISKNKNCGDEQMIEKKNECATHISGVIFLS